MARLIEAYMPAYDVRAAFETTVRAPASATYDALRRVDLFRPWSVRLLFAIRRFPTRGADARVLATRTFEHFERSGALLAEEPGREALFALIGRFWDWRRPAYSPLAPDDFVGFRLPGWAKAVVGFSVEPIDERTSRLLTETRVQCTDPASRRRFRLYWTVIERFSGLIRIVWLREIRMSAERAALGSPRVAGQGEGGAAGI